MQFAHASNFIHFVRFCVEYNNFFGTKYLMMFIVHDNHCRSTQFILHNVLPAWGQLFILRFLFSIRFFYYFFHNDLSQFMLDADILQLNIFQYMYTLSILCIALFSGNRLLSNKFCNYFDEFSFTEHVLSFYTTCEVVFFKEI